MVPLVEGEVGDVDLLSSPVYTHIGSLEEVQGARAGGPGAMRAVQSVKRGPGKRRKTRPQALGMRSVPQGAE